MSSVVLHLGKEHAGKHLAHGEFAEADFAEPWRYERVQGRLVVMSPSGHEHAVTCQAILQHLFGYRLQRSSVIEFVVPEAWLAVDDDTDRIVDVAVYLRGSSTARIPARVPDLVFEVVSPSASDRRRDYEQKRKELERLGVKEYVVVDRFERRVTVFRLSQGRYTETVLGMADVYTTPLLPGLAIPLAEVFLA